jgi:hypothetical protein
MSITTANVVYRGEKKKSLVFKDCVDMSRFALSKIRNVIINKYNVTLDVDPNKWNFYVNGVILNTLEASVKSLRKLGIVSEEITFNLEYKTDLIVKTQDGREYSLKDKIRKTMKENMNLFKTDLKTNGMVNGEIQMVMGHFKTLLMGIKLPIHMNNVYLNMDFMSNNSPVHIVKEKRSEALILSPYITFKHASLLCVMKNDRIIHIDPSGSISANNNSLMRLKSNNISYTFFNYQLLDESVDQYAGGNCAIFTCLNLLRCIIHYDNYNKKHEFTDFWDRFMQISTLSDSESVYTLLNNGFYRAIYMKLTNNGKDKDDFGNSVDFMEKEQLPMDLIKDIFPKEFDFTADCIMLDLLIDSNIAFQDVTKLGNILREMIKEITQHGFVNSYCKFLGQKYKWI